VAFHQKHFLHFHLSFLSLLAFNIHFTPQRYRLSCTKSWYKRSEIFVFPAKKRRKGRFADWH